MIIPSMHTIILGEPKAILEIHFQSLKDEDIAIGQLVVLWEDILCRKIGADLYEIFDLQDYRVKVPDFDGDTMFMDITREFSHNLSLLDDNLNRHMEPTSKYIKTSKGTKRRRPWESSSFF